MGNPLTVNAFKRLLDKRVDLWYGEGYKEIPSLIEDFYTIDTTQKLGLEIYGLGDIPDPVLFNGTITYQDLAPGYWSKIDDKEYAGGITIERLLLVGDQYGKIENMAKRLGRAMQRKRNKLAIELITEADSSAFTFMTSEEGVALASNSHTTKAVGVSTASGFDNLSTLAFSAPNLETLRLQGQGLRSDIGERRDEADFDMILIPPELEEAVWEVIKTPGKVDEMTNNLNFQKGRWTYKVIKQWGDSDTNDWAIVDSKMMKQCNVWHDLVAPEFNNMNDFDTLMRKYSSYMAVGAGTRDWRWIVFSSVS